MDKLLYLSPKFRTQPGAADFNEFLDDNLLWHADDFGGNYAWNTDIPPRDQWQKTVDEFNEHLREIERLRGR